MFLDFLKGDLKIPFKSSYRKNWKKIYTVWGSEIDYFYVNTK